MDATATMEYEARDICERSDGAWDRLDDLLRAMVRLEVAFNGIKAEALVLLHDGYGYDPDDGGAHPIECEAALDAYSEAGLAAERLAAARMSLIAPI